MAAVVAVAAIAVVAVAVAGAVAKVILGDASGDGNCCAG